MRPLLALLLLTPGMAEAQALTCRIPARLERPRADVASPNQPRRLLPIGGYTLAVTWAPGYCRYHKRDASARFQCGGGNRFDFTLHGLWPDGMGKDWPQYCAATGLLPAPVIRANLCATPSAQLLQHEWAKHGTCMAGYTPARYFARSTGLFGRLRWPEMDRLSRRPLTAGQLAAAVAARNPGLSADAVRVTTDRRGWLDELWLCLDRRFRYERCRADSGGVPAAAAVRIWRGRR